MQIFSASSLPSSTQCVVFIIGIFCLFARPGRGQVEVRVGVKEGGNFATLKGEDWQQMTAPAQTPAKRGQRPGLIIGGVAVFDPSGPFALQSELLWIWKGAKVHVEETQTTTKLNYVELPLLAKYRPPVSWGPFSTHLLAGPTMGLTTQAERNEMTRDASGRTRFVGRTNLGPATRDVEVGFAVGGEFGYRFSNAARLMLELRYRRSLTRAFGQTDEPVGTGSALDAWNQGVAVTMGFVYSIGRTTLFN